MVSLTPVAAGIGRSFPLLLLGSGSRLDKSAARRAAAQRRLAACFAAAVELLARAGDLRLIADRPRPERGDRGQQIASKRGERVIDARRDGREYRARDQPVALEPA